MVRMRPTTLLTCEMLAFRCNVYPIDVIVTEKLPLHTRLTAQKRALPLDQNSEWTSHDETEAKCYSIAAI